MTDNTVAVLDLGSTKVACLLASQGTKTKPDALSIKAVASVPCRGMRKGQVSDLQDVSRAIRDAVTRVQTQTGEEIDDLVVGISGCHIEGANAQGLRLLYPSGRKITHQDVLEVIKHSREISLGQEREQIQALPREFRVDGQRNVLKPVGMNGSKLEVLTYIVSGLTSSLQNIEQVVNSAGKQVEQMVLQSLASGIGVLTAQEMEMGAAVIDIGGGTSDIAIFANGSIVFSASVPLGGLSVTNDLSQLLKTSPEEAERLKIQSGHARANAVGDKETVEVQQLGQPVSRPMQRRVLCEIIESRMREIARLIGKELDDSPFSTVLPGGIALTGGGSMLPGVDRLFEETLVRFRVRVAEPDLGPAVTPQPGMATSVGLASFALQCFDEFVPAEGQLPWRERVKTLFSLLQR